MPFLPLHDDNPRIRIGQPWVTYAIIALCVFAFLQEIGGGERFFVETIYAYGSIPAVVTGQQELPPELQRIPAPLTLLTSAFLHGDWMHLLGNMLFLWVFGDNIEDAMGHVRFIFFYGLCALAAALGHVAIDPSSVVPMVGASGAISGVLGGYLILHPHARVMTPIGFIPIYLPAWLLLGIWFGFQFFMASQASGGGGGVAWYAHIGGFIAGMVMIFAFKHSTVRAFASRDMPSGLRIRRRRDWGKD